MKIADYLNTSKFIDSCWTPQIICYDKNGEEILTMELDLYESPKSNLAYYRNKHPEHKFVNVSEFRIEFNKALLETKYQAMHTRQQDAKRRMENEIFNGSPLHYCV